MITPHSCLPGLIIGLGLLCVPARGAEVILQNDSAPPGTALTAFLSGERVAGWFTVPTSGDIVGVQIVWGSLFGGAPASLETSITVSAGGMFPAPGPALATVVAPTLIDMAPVNEFRFLDPLTNNTPMQVPVTAGQVIVVDLEFLNTNSGNPFAASIEHDQDGCQAGVNSVFAVPGGWADACTLGVTGDFGIRAILDPVPEPSSSILVAAALGITLLRRRRGARDGEAD